MKKYLTMIAVAVLSICVSCNDETKKADTTSITSENKTSATTQKNLDALDSINASFLTGDVSRLGNFIATDAVDHAGENGDIKGLDSIKAMFVYYNSMMSDMKSEVVKELADDDYGMQWLHMTGTMKMASMGMKPGDKYDMTAMEVCKFNSDSKITEHWEFMQPADMMKMMGGAGAGGKK